MGDTFMRRTQARRASSRLAPGCARRHNRAPRAAPPRSVLIVLTAIEAVPPEP